MEHPTFDKDGYPTDETLEAIKLWPLGKFETLLEFIFEAWDDTYGVVREDERAGTMELVTGGWSGNEEILSAMMFNRTFWSIYWESSSRGGLTVLRKPRK